MPPLSMAAPLGSSPPAGSIGRYDSSHFGMAMFGSRLMRSIALCCVMLRSVGFGLGRVVTLWLGSARLVPSTVVDGRLPSL